MTGQLSRRDALQTLALAGAGAIVGAPSPSFAIPAPEQHHSLDEILKRAVDAREVPGVVAMAATGDAIIYEGAFGPRCIGTASKMTASLSEAKKRKTGFRCQLGRDVETVEAMPWSGIFREKWDWFNGRVAEASLGGADVDRGGKTFTEGTSNAQRSTLNVQ